MIINHNGTSTNIPLPTKALMRDGCYYIRNSEDSEIYYIGLHVPKLLCTSQGLFKLLRAWVSVAFNVPLSRTAKTIMLDGDFGMAIQITCNSGQRHYSLSVVGVLGENKQAGNFEIVSFESREQRVVDRYVIRYNKLRK